MRLKWTPVKPKGEVAIVDDLAFWLSAGSRGGFYLSACRPFDLEDPMGPGEHLGSWESPVPFRFRSKKTGSVIIERRNSRNWSKATAKRWARERIVRFLAQHASKA